jgi:hypothetical protein
MVDLSWVHVLQNLQQLPVKIASLLLLPQPLPPFAMQRVNLRSYTAVREISASALQLLNDFQVYVTLSLLVHL